jgi:hypothetical protein
MAPAKSVLQIDFRKIGLADRLLQNRSRRSTSAKSVLQIGSCKIGLADRLLQNRSRKMAPAKWFLQNGLGRNGAALPGVSLSGSLAPC